jgi:hypothetical protein
MVGLMVGLTGRYKNRPNPAWAGLPGNRLAAFVWQPICLS